MLLAANIGLNGGYSSRKTCPAAPLLGAAGIAANVLHIPATSGTLSTGRFALKGDHLKTMKLTAASAAKSAADTVRPVLARVRHFVPALAMMAVCLFFSAVGAHAQTGPTIPPTDTFNSSFADVQTWSTSLIAGPGKYVIYTMLSFIGFGLVVSWIKRSVKTH